MAVTAQQIADLAGVSRGTVDRALHNRGRVNPEVKEKLEELGIPVMIERSSYEKHPLGRLEWIRLFGVLFNQEQQANKFFREQAERVQPILEKENTGLSIFTPKHFPVSVDFPPPIAKIMSASFTS